MIKKLVRIIFPAFIISYLQYFNKIRKIYIDYYYDIKRFVKYSATLEMKDIQHLEGKIIAHYHVIEKGLSYKEIKLGFGQEIVYNLINLVIEYNNRGGDRMNKQYLTSISVLKKYINLHQRKNYDISKIEKKFEYIKTSEKFDFGGPLLLIKNDLITKSKLNFKEFALSRFSIREFTNQEVDLESIEEAVFIAQKTPSVCNRQTSRVYIVKDKIDIEKHLSFQNGTRGFGHKINKLLVITSDLNYFDTSFERNQSFIDGGLFSMSILNALHYNELGAVALNWSTSGKNDAEYRKYSKIKDSENIIMMIGVGHIPEQVNVPKSERKLIKEVLTYV